jgi:dipeptidyl aminopeptidase/acylaminoacyl peptidase
MTRFLTRFVVLLWLCTIGVVLLALGIGRMLSQEDEVVFASSQGRGLYRMALMRDLIAPFITSKDSLTQPNWSADGQHMAYVNSASAQLALYITDAEGHKQQLLTDLLNSSDYDPRWSPDSRYIAYSTSVSGAFSGNKIDVMLFDTQTQVKQRLITTNIFRGHMLSWSPDGTQLALVLYSPERQNSDIFTINIHTGKLQELVSTPANDEYPVWSPDGRFIAFVSGDGQRELYLLDVATGQTSLLYNLFGVSYPSDWSQDSRFIYVTLTYDIYKLDVSSCMQNSNNCIPALLIIGGEDARRKPTTR